MKVQIRVVVLASFTSLILAVPVPDNDNSRKQLVKRGIFDSITHFPFLASSSSAHGSSSSSSSSSTSDDDHEFHSHIVHNPVSHDFGGHHDDFQTDHNFATSYQNQYFGNSHEFPSYHDQHLFDDHLSSFNNKYESHSDPFESHQHDPLLQYSHLDAPDHIGQKFGHLNTHIDDYNNYGGDLGQYSNIHAGYLDISDDRKIDNLLDPLSPNHSSYDSY